MYINKKKTSVGEMKQGIKKKKKEVSTDLTESALALSCCAAAAAANVFSSKICSFFARVLEWFCKRGSNWLNFSRREVKEEVCASKSGCKLSRSEAGPSLS